ncbi:Cys-tRNA(Pro) deacylase [Caldibacillus lycopersici]|uniref:Cys-tRNA(Pro)/Cys-tRNA(Cys) deacylase n=1 Tax=Perspicuibacillus lycopersici TaxID=1325689 RepID=A0AAE3IUT4_9BACI|nr:Cys-tRNA(Pro) deacylase [Perspicuibacillus lycopersici]MCU9615035.1 Cys-tRNA(Pro) deacylase [Perspicuibacillus lycopersici]
MMSTKTNAIRILDKEKINYNIFTYDVNDGKINGTTVADKINRAEATVFKTLVTHQGQNIYIFVIPVMAELDLKKAAKAAGEKKIEMLHVKDLQKYTGYIRGGCSPIGMKKSYPTFIDLHAKDLPSMVVSAGKIGMQMELAPEALANVVHAKFVDVIK